MTSLAEEARRASDRRRPQRFNAERTRTGGRRSLAALTAATALLGTVDRLLLSIGICLFAASSVGGQVSSAEAPSREVGEALQEAPRSWMARLIDVMDLQSGMTAADIGAGEGRWAARMAQHVGAEGQVFATEIVERLLGEIRQTANELGVDNVVPVLGSETDASLPPECCDRILARLSYHEFTHREAMLATMFEALKPGGVLVIIENSGEHAHSIAPRYVIPQVSAAGFEFVRQIDGWNNRPTRYLQLYRKPWYDG